MERFTYSADYSRLLPMAITDNALASVTAEMAIARAANHNLAQGICAMLELASANKWPENAELDVIMAHFSAAVVDNV